MRVFIFSFFLISSSMILLVLNLNYVWFWFFNFLNQSFSWFLNLNKFNFFIIFYLNPLNYLSTQRFHDCSQLKSLNTFGESSLMKILNFTKNILKKNTQFSLLKWYFTNLFKVFQISINFRVLNFKVFSYRKS